MEKCGLPETYETSHCFNDSTHHTCCMLGPEARKYADESDNPIGSASLKAFRKKFNRNPNQNEKTGWCTCFGSEVCSFYANKFNDGTHIKFINNPYKNNIVKNVSPKCEGYFRNKFNVESHGTPGVKNKKLTNYKNLQKICEKNLTNI